MAHRRDGLHGLGQWSFGALSIVLVFASCALQQSHSSPSNWLLTNANHNQQAAYQSFNAANLERESDSPQTSGPHQPGLNSPARNLQNMLRLSQHFRQGRLPSQLELFEAQSASSNQQAFGADLFHCVEPRVDLYQSFVRQYNRTFHDNGDYGDDGDEQRKKAEMSDRWDLFRTTLQRAILFNRVIQNDVLNRSNYNNKPDIRNYYFVEPVGLLSSDSGAGQSAFADQQQQQQQQQQQPIMWYADITDCELGLIKHILFDIFYLIDKNDLEFALKLATDNMDHLPLFNEQGFEQLANILLLRLFDRFRGDEKMNQLFQWPIYMKKLASFAYARRQMSKPDFKTKLALISYAYPSYFKDLKYNWPAINRTGDNIRANNEHKRFNLLNNRAFANLAERNKRLAIFRQRWSLINQLNADGDSSGMSILNVQPDWLRVQANLNDDEPTNAKLTQDSEADSFFQPPTTKKATVLPPKRAYNLTQFTDLTDLEFVAFLSNDFSILDNNRESAQYIDRNFPVRQLDVDFKEEIALELELRRASLANLIDLDKQQKSTTTTTAPVVSISQPGLQLARQVVDELISDVGLPIGPVVLENIKETEMNSVFNRLVDVYRKSYSSLANSLQAKQEMANKLQLPGGPANSLSEPDVADERVKRYEQFKSNYGRFRAWFIKEGWEPSGTTSGQINIITDQQLVAMLRLTDLSWLEIKLTLFKVCCLTPDNLISLSSFNATIQYLASNSATLCQPLSDSSLQDEYVRFNQLEGGANESTRKSVQQRQEMIALELYYYYCVHFNKHHSSLEEFERKFMIFRRNIDSIRRHSCKRSLTLFESLKLKQSEYLNSVDVLDPRRSFTDDLNLDRFEYFRLANSRDGGQDSLLDLAARRAADLIAVAPSRQQQQQQSSSSSSSSSLAGRVGGVTYRRAAPFNELLQQSKVRADLTPDVLYPSPRSPFYSLAGRLLEHNEHDLNELQRKYAQYNVGQVYELVWHRYKYCMKTTRNVDLYRSDFRQQCKSRTAKFADLARNQNAPGSLVGLGAGDLISFESPDEASRRASARLKQAEGQCEFYRQGLEPWAEGLVKQDHRYTYLIKDAKC